jgi:putative endonuclease
MFYVYILQSNSHLYIGLTNDLKRRVSEHNTGRSRFTKRYLPWNLIFYEAYSNEEDAHRREGYFKTSQGRQAIRRMLKNQLVNQDSIDYDYEGSTTG